MALRMAIRSVPSVRRVLTAAAAGAASQGVQASAILPGHPLPVAVRSETNQGTTQIFPAETHFGETHGVRRRPGPSSGVLPHQAPLAQGDQVQVQEHMVSPLYDFLCSVEDACGQGLSHASRHFRDYWPYYAFLVGGAGIVAVVYVGPAVAAGAVQATFGAVQATFSSIWAALCGKPIAGALSFAHKHDHFFF